MIDRFLKIDSICNEVNSVLEEYELEIMNLLAIKEAADFGKISDRIFSLDLLKVKIVSVAAGLGYKYTDNQVIEIIEGAKAVTVIEGDFIHSIAMFPIPKYDFEYYFVKFPIFQENDLKILNRMMQISMKPLDIFLCPTYGKELSFDLRIISSKDLNDCFHTSKKDRFFCFGRNVILSGSNPIGKSPCHYDQLPETILIELTDDNILVKSHRDDFYVRCQESSTHLKLNFTDYTIIKINRTCDLVNQNIIFSDNPHNMDVTQNTNFETIASYKMDFGNIFGKSSNDPWFKNGGFSNFRKETRKDLNETFKAIDKIDKSNMNKIKVLKENIDMHYIYNWTGIIIGLICSGFIVLLGTCTCIKFSKLKKRSKSNANTLIRMNDIAQNIDGEAENLA